MYNCCVLALLKVCIYKEAPLPLKKSMYNKRKDLPIVSKKHSNPPISLHRQQL